jgi:hypothetical protein
MLVKQRRRTGNSHANGHVKILSCAAKSCPPEKPGGKRPFEAVKVSLWRTEARLAAIEEQRLQNDADCYADSLGAGRIKLPSGSSVCWSGRHGDDEPAKVIAAQIWPLPPMPIIELVRRKILSLGRIDSVAFARAVEELPR